MNHHSQPLDLDYPNLASCKIKLVGGSAASSRPPVQLPRSVRISAAEAAAATSDGGNGNGSGDDGTYDFSLGTFLGLRIRCPVRIETIHRFVVHCPF